MWWHSSLLPALMRQNAVSSRSAWSTLSFGPTRQRVQDSKVTVGESTGVNVVARALARVRWWLWGSEAELNCPSQEASLSSATSPSISHHLTAPNSHHPGRLSSA